MATPRELVDPHHDTIFWRVKHGVLQWSYAFERYFRWYIHVPCDREQLRETPERLVLWTELYLNPTD